MRKTSITIFVFNAVEDEWRYLSSFASRTNRKRAIDSTNKYADCYLFASAGETERGARFFFISPVPVSTMFKTYIENITGVPIEIYVPKISSGLICEDAAKDEKIIRKIVTNIGPGQSANFVSYAPSRQAYVLVDRLMRAGIKISAPHLPDERKFVSSLSAGTKNGFRMLFSRPPLKKHSCLLPPGKMCRSVAQAAETAARIYLDHRSVVIKSALGSAGNGVIIFRDGSLPGSRDECVAAVHKKLAEKPVWATAPIVVEQYIKTHGSPVPFPSVEYVATADTTIPRMLYYCAMTVKPDGEFYGMHMHESVLPAELKKRVLIRSNLIAAQIAKRGYRGHFDIDMMISNDGAIYASESNVRYTGGTDIFLFTRKLYGASFFTDAYVISGYRDLPKKHKHTLTNVMRLLKPVLLNKSKTGIVINSESVIRNHGLSYAAIGRTKRQAQLNVIKMNAILDR